MSVDKCSLSLNFSIATWKQISPQRDHARGRKYIGSTGSIPVQCARGNAQQVPTLNLGPTPQCCYAGSLGGFAEAGTGFPRVHSSSRRVLEYL